MRIQVTPEVRVMDRDCLENVAGHTGTVRRVQGQQPDNVAWPAVHRRGGFDLFIREQSTGEGVSVWIARG